jgi:hypothetical protein
MYIILQNSLLFINHRIQQQTVSITVLIVALLAILAMVQNPLAQVVIMQQLMHISLNQIVKLIVHQNIMAI